MSFFINGMTNLISNISVTGGTSISAGAFTWIIGVKLPMDQPVDANYVSIMDIQTGEGSLLEVSLHESGDGSRRNALRLSNDFDSTWVQMYNPMPFNRWITLAYVGYLKATVKTGRLYMQVPGQELVYVETLIGAGNTTARDFYVGALYAGYGANIICNHSKLWNVALAPEEVQLEMNTIFPQRRAGLVNYNDFRGANMDEVFTSVLTNGAGTTMSSWRVSYFNSVDLGTGSAAAPLVHSDVWVPQQKIYQRNRRLRFLGSPYAEMVLSPRVIEQSNANVVVNTALGGNLLVPAARFGDSQLMVVNYMPRLANLATPYGWKREFDYMHYKIGNAGAANTLNRIVFFRREVGTDMVAANANLQFSYTLATGTPNVAYTATAITIRNGVFDGDFTTSDTEVATYPQANFPPYPVHKDNSLAIGVVVPLNLHRTFTRAPGYSIISNPWGNAASLGTKGVAHTVQARPHVAQGTMLNVSQQVSVLDVSTGLKSPDDYTTITIIYQPKPTFVARPMGVLSIGFGGATIFGPAANAAVAMATQYGYPAVRCTTYGDALSLRLTPVPESNGGNVVIRLRALSRDIFTLTYNLYSSNSLIASYAHPLTREFDERSLNTQQIQSITDWSNLWVSFYQTYQEGGSYTLFKSFEVRTTGATRKPLIVQGTSLKEVSNV